MAPRQPLRLSPTVPLRPMLPHLPPPVEAETLSQRPNPAHLSTGATPATAASQLRLLEVATTPRTSLITTCAPSATIVTWGLRSSSSRSSWTVIALSKSAGTANIPSLVEGDAAMVQSTAAVAAGVASMPLLVLRTATRTWMPVSQKQFAVASVMCPMLSSKLLLLLPALLLSLPQRKRKFKTSRRSSHPRRKKSRLRLLHLSKMKRRRRLLRLRPKPRSSLPP
mmetsp:Transcript_4553/g.6309  ORF Transcript_4553/g.6309 Transcript_4553/m.6309 type:complete len:224 (-) Transcript_4553:841-1512(-)